MGTVVPPASPPLPEAFLLFLPVASCYRPCGHWWASPGLGVNSRALGRHQSMVVILAETSLSAGPGEYAMGWRGEMSAVAAGASAARVKLWSAQKP